MKFIPLELAGAFLIEPERREDPRGFFARTWCRREFADQGLEPRLEQCNVSFNASTGTLRGMHYQVWPHEEVKLVRCTRGAIHDVIVDLRPAAATFGRWMATELTQDNRRMLYVPAGFAHGFQTLLDDTEVFYQMSEFYHPESARGVRWNNPFFGIVWPLPDPLLSERDAEFADFVK